jgi:dipeptidyl aminopeptidase/acylaminoacyl peptidase
VLYTASTGSNLWDKAKIFVQRLRPAGARKLIIEGGTDARYVPTGHIVYAYQGTLFAIPFDLKRLEVTGGPVPVVEGVRRAPPSGTAQFSLSHNGSLVYIPGPVSTGGEAQLTLGVLDRNGQLERLKLPLKAYAFPRLSPDGKQVAVSTDDKDPNVWIVNLAGETAPRQLTLGGANRYPVWSWDGKRVAFQSDREGDPGIFWQNADGTGTAERLTKADSGTMHIPDSWSHDGKSFSYTVVKDRDAAVWIFSPQDKKSGVFAEKTGAFIGRSAFSPDGRWVTYQSTETGNDEIFVQPFPPTGSKYPIARGGWPFWSPDGRELVYNPGAGQMGFVVVSTKPAFSFTQPSILTRLSGLVSRAPLTNPRAWDFAPDGKRILGAANAAEQNASGTEARQIDVVLNWFTDLQQRLPVK